MTEIEKAVMETYLFSIHPKWCEKIFNGEKTIEVRKTAPKPPFKVVVYCTKGNTKIYLGKDRIFHTNCAYDFETGELLENILMNGKVIGEFICDKVYRTDWDSCGVFLRDLQSGAVINGQDGFTEYRDNDITRAQHIDYAGMKCAYALHITAPVLYDEPKELGEFYKPCIMPEMPYCPACKYGNVQYSPDEVECASDLEGASCEWLCLNSVKRPPQSYMRIQDTKED